MVTTRRRRLTRAGPLAWLLGLYWVGMAMLAVALIADERPALSAVIGALGLALAVRMAQMGVYGDDQELRCVSWLTTRHVPLADVDPQVLTSTSTSTHSPYKGDARYYSVTPPAGTIADAGWTYPEAYEAVASIRGHVAWYPDRVTIEVTDA